jgi:hypothetical protein
VQDVVVLVHPALAGVEVTTYEVMGVPPLLLGAFHVIVALSPTAVAETLNGRLETVRPLAVVKVMSFAAPRLLPSTDTSLQLYEVAEFSELNVIGDFFADVEMTTAPPTEH